MKIRKELLEALTRQCVKEFLDQVEEDAKAGALKSSGIGSKDGAKPVKQVPTKFSKDKGFKVKIKEEEEETPVGDVAPPENGLGTGDQPAIPKEDPKPEEKPEETPEEPEVPETPEPTAVKGAQVINPKDKSKLEPIKWTGRDESTIERTLHQIAVSKAGARTKVSLGAKRMARELSSNPNSTAYFYFGKMDPESEEIFLMADKSLQVAKDGSVQPSELTGTPVSNNIPTHKNFTAMVGDDEYANYMKQRNLPTPRYGIDENAKKIIKRVINKLLDS